MEAFRISRTRYAGQLSGEGASLGGGRWNSIGTSLIYTASNRSLAMAEVAVHLSLAALPEDFLMLAITIPDDITLDIVSIDHLSTDWRLFPYSTATQAVGDRFVVEGRYCVLQAPSAVTRGDYNLLINPRHREFERIEIISREPFPFDRRLIR